MAPNHLIPTAPCKNPMGPTAKLPHAPPTACPSSGQDSPNNFTLLQRSVKRDAQQIILAVLQLLLFAQAVIGFCRVTAGIPGTQADRAQYLGTMQLVSSLFVFSFPSSSFFSPIFSSLQRFTDQADFLCIAEQKGLFDSLTTTLPVINCNAANNSTNIQSFLTFADAILKIKKNHHKVQHQQEAEVQHQQEAEVQCQREAEELKRRTQDQDVNMLANLKPGSEAMLSLLSQVDAALETVQLANDDALLPRADLQKHREAVQLAAQQQLYSLNIAFQVITSSQFALLVLTKVLAPPMSNTPEICSTICKFCLRYFSLFNFPNSLLFTLETQIVDSNSNIEITPSSSKNPCLPVLVQEATIL
ncbi:hypothetical protein J132_05939 [Termitomyces sp. J132]|nr:hypothetical protein J132_05939 [Termitomyces sp. J132]